MVAKHFESALGNSARVVGRLALQVDAVSTCTNQIKLLVPLLCLHPPIQSFLTTHLFDQVYSAANIRFLA
jgi:hypothetical protein